MKLRQASILDLALLKEILAQSFNQNGSVNFVVRQDRKREKRIEHLIDFSIRTGIRKGAVHISSDNTGAAIWFIPGQKKDSILDYLDQAKLAFRSIGISRINKVLKREAYIAKIKPKEPHIYFWYLGVLEEGRGKTAIRELSRAVFEESKQLDLPIFLETSEPRNVKLYQHAGFEVYHEWKTDLTGFTTYFMKRAPQFYL